MAVFQMLVVLTLLVLAAAQRNQHQPQLVSWVVISVVNGEILNSTKNEVIPQTWWPDLYFNFCDLARGSWDIGDWTPLHKGSPNVGVQEDATCHTCPIPSIRAAHTS